MVAVPKGDVYHIEDGQFEERMAIHTAIAEQIWREQQLVSYRMTWNGTFQAFLSAIYVFAGNHPENPEAVHVQGVMTVLGFLVSSFCYFGITAAQAQSSKLKEHWLNVFHRRPIEDAGFCDILFGAYPQPFSRRQGSRLGRLASRGVCYVLIFTWLLLMKITVATHPDFLDFLATHN